MNVNDEEDRNGSSLEKEEVKSLPEQITEQSGKGPRTLKGEQITPGKRLLAASILSLMCFSTTFSSSAYASSALSIEKYFNTSQEIVLLGVALFVLGFAIGPLFFGPLSFVIGKRPVYIMTFVSFTGKWTLKHARMGETLLIALLPRSQAFSFGAAESRNIETLIILRFLAGACGSSALNNVPASLSDVSWI